MAAADSTGHEEPLIPPAGGSVLGAPVRYWSTVLLPLLLAIPAQVETLVLVVMDNILGSCVGLKRQKDTVVTGEPQPYHPGYTITRLTRNLQYITPDESNLKPPGQRRLVLLYVWLTAKPRHIRKYSKLLTDLGLHVLVVSSYLSDFVKPPTGSQAVGVRVREFLRDRCDEFEKMFVYGFSVGAYVYCEMVIKLREDAALHRRVISKFVGQVWDSPVDLEGSCLGVAHSMTDRPALQNIIASMAEWLMKVRHASATRHFEAASRVMHDVPIMVPAIYIYSKNDPMSPGYVNEGIANKWRAKDIELKCHLFEHKDTGHCMNYSVYPSQYRTILYDFMGGVGMVERKLIDSAVQSLTLPDRNNDRDEYEKLKVES